MWVKWEAYLKVPDDMKFDDQFWNTLAAGLMKAGVQVVDSPSAKKVSD